jgi:hypothetical protein
MDETDLVWAVVIGVVVGLGGGRVLRRSHPHRGVAVLLAFAAAVLGSLLAGVVGVGDRPGFEPVERLLQFVFAGATLMLAGRLADS